MHEKAQSSTKMSSRVTQGGPTSGVTVIYASPRNVCPRTHFSSAICSPGTDITSIIGTLPTVLRVSQGQVFPTNFKVHGNNLISIRDSTFRIQQAKGNTV